MMNKYSDWIAAVDAEYQALACETLSAAFGGAEKGQKRGRESLYLPSRPAFERYGAAMAEEAR